MTKINKIIIPQTLNKNGLINFFKKKDLELVIKENKKPTQTVNEFPISKAYKPELDNLYRLYQLVILNRRTTILEFGSGWSSLIFSLALKENKKKYSNQMKKLRRNNPFELFVIENEKKYLKLSKKRILNFYKKKKINDSIKSHWLYSEVEMTTFSDRFATQYKSLPICNPDFIYLDGPDQFKIKKKIQNFTTAHRDAMPMACDILRFEYFLTPGTIIVVDGRSANAKFLEDNFNRKWLHTYEKSFDAHIFYLDDPSLGRYNDLQLKFYSKK